MEDSRQSLAQWRGPETAQTEDLRKWITSLQVSELFWVAKDMRLVAQAAAEDMLPLVMTHEDLPCDRGLLVWEGEVHGVAGIAWEAVGGRVKLNALIPRKLAFDRIKSFHSKDPARVKEMLAELLPTQSSLLPDITQPVPLGEELTAINIYLRTMPQDEMDQTISVFLPTMAMALWHLLGQTLAAPEFIRPSKAGLKHMARLNADMFTTTRYVTLRHMKPDHYEKSETETGFHYSVRFEVREHKRKIQDRENPGQFREITVRAHIRGPEGAPMLPPDRKVNVLRK
jgi:hypothetical protein